MDRNKVTVFTSEDEGQKKYDSEETCYICDESFEEKDGEAISYLKGVIFATITLASM